MNMSEHKSEIDRSIECAKHMHSEHMDLMNLRCVFESVSFEFNRFHLAFGESLANATATAEVTKMFIFHFLTHFA